jgi:hypothetical protein
MKTKPGKREGEPYSSCFFKCTKKEEPALPKVISGVMFPQYGACQSDDLEQVVLV